jgi:hypothetical protein
MGVTEVVGTILLSGTGGAVINTGVQNLLNRRKLGADTDKVEIDAADVVTKAALVLDRKSVARIRGYEKRHNPTGGPTP